MSSSVKPEERPCFLQRSISVRPATTTDGFTVMANKHFTYHIEEGTLDEAIENGYVDSHEAFMARTNKARCIAREIMDSKLRQPKTLKEIRQELKDTFNFIKAQTAPTATNDLIDDEADLSSKADDPDAKS